MIAVHGKYKNLLLPSAISEAQLETIATLWEDDNQTGFHPGQDANPVTLMRHAPEGEYLFRISGKGQFDVTWQAWRVKAEL